MKGFILLGAFLAAAVTVRGQSVFDTIGVTALRAEDASLTGSGVIVSQVESAPSPLQFEVDPGSPGQRESLFVWSSSSGLAVTFPNSVGSESPHADSVAEAFYGVNTGVAPGVLHVGNYETAFFYPKVIQAKIPARAAVFNQSFEFGPHDVAADLAYDDYMDLYRTTIVSGIGDGGAVLSPADCYNGIGVAAYGGASSAGPTADGRCKPDITAPAGATSFSTPLVSGAAAVLIQAGRGLGVNATAANDSRTVKALLLNGAVKPPGWTHSVGVPLDRRYGAGILNVFNSYNELVAGRLAPAAATLSGTGHPALTTGTGVVMPRGWDVRGIASSRTEFAVSHYLITTTGSGALITTLVWDKPYGVGAINRLSLFVYDSGGELLGSSQSAVDNVQQVSLENVAAGTYEIQVVKGKGAIGAPGVVCYRDAYALAWDFGR